MSEKTHTISLFRQCNGKCSFKASGEAAKASPENTLAATGKISTIPAPTRYCSEESNGFSPYLPMPTATLRNNIRRLRFERGMTQEELALRVGVSRQTIMSIERGATNPSVLLAYKISMALNAPVTEVFSVEGSLVPV